MDIGFFRVVMISLVITFIPNFLYAEDTVVIGFVKDADNINTLGNRVEKPPLVGYWLNTVCPLLGVKCKFRTINFARMLHELKVGEIDVLLLASKNKTRETFAYYPPFEELILSAQLVVLRDSPLIEIKDSSDLYSYNVGSAIGTFVPKMLEDPNIFLSKTSGINWKNQNLLKLRAKRIDVAYFPTPDSVVSAYAEIDFCQQLRIISLPETARLYTIFSKKSTQGKALFEKYIKVVAKNNLLGVYQKQYDNYWNKRLGLCNNH